MNEKPFKEFKYGIHSFYKGEIERILKENDVQPQTILKILIANKLAPESNEATEDYVFFFK